MAVIRVVKAPDGENATLSVNTPSTQVLKYYKVECSSIADGAELVMVANDGTTAIPALRSLLGDGSTGLVVTDVRPERDGKSDTWKVTVTYGVLSSVAPPEGSTIWAVNIRADGLETQEDTDTDNANHAIVNKAGDLFNPGLKKSIYDRRLTISYSCTTAHMNTAVFDDCRGKVNAAAIVCTVNGLEETYAADCLKLVESSYATRFLPGYGADPIQIWDVDLLLIYRAPFTEGGTTYTGWTKRIENKGYYAIDSATSKKYLICDDHGQPKTKPSFLDSTGHELAAGGTVTYVYANVEYEADFSGLFSGIGS